MACLLPVPTQPSSAPPQVAETCPHLLAIEISYLPMCVEAAKSCIQHGLRTSGFKPLRASGQRTVEASPESCPTLGKLVQAKAYHTWESRGNVAVESEGLPLGTYPGMSRGERACQQHTLLQGRAQYQALSLHASALPRVWNRRLSGERALPSAQRLPRRVTASGGSTLPVSSVSALPSLLPPGRRRRREGSRGDDIEAAVFYKSLVR